MAHLPKGVKAAFYGFGFLAFVILGMEAGYTISGNQYKQQIAGLEKRLDTVGFERAREAELTVIRLDLQELPHLSEQTRNAIVSSLDSASREYRIPVGFLHAIFRIESNYQFQIDHPKVPIRVKGKSVIIQAKGLGGIVWEIWADSLKARGICNAVSDLYIPEKNIMASAYILRYETDRVLQAHGATAPYKLIREIIKNYYGAYSAPYEARMMQVTNELWLKRIAKDLITS